MKYYDIHVNKNKAASYSIFFKANIDNEEEALKYAIDHHLFEEDGDEQCVDYIRHTDEKDYHDATGE